MGSSSRPLLITAAAVIAFVAAAVLLTMQMPPVNHGVEAKVNKVTSEFSIADQSVVSSLMSLNIPIYVVGSSTLVSKLTALGIAGSLIRLINISQLPLLPNGSLVIVDWPIISPGLIISRGGVVQVNVGSMGFRLIAFLVRRGDFIIIHGNSTEVPVIEYALALAWSEAFNTGIVAIPAPKFPNNLNYIVAYGNDKMLIIGPHTLKAALSIANEIWTPLIMKKPTTNPEDLCAELAQNYSVSVYNQPVQISSSAYAIVYGPQSYSDSFGSFTVDFCTIWSTVFTNDLNGASAGYAELYNFIEYWPQSGTQIEYLKSFHDAYASYMVYEYEMGYIGAPQLPGDVLVIAGSGGGYKPGYWTDPYFEPQELVCSSSTTYGISLGVSFSTSGAGITITGPISQTYSCPYYTIFPTGSPQTQTTMNIVAGNATWIFTPQNAQAATARQSYGVESDGYTYMGPAYNPQSSAYTIPAGSSVVVKNGACTEHIVYDINWDVWVNSSGTINPYSSGIYIVPPAASSWSSNNGFYYTESCQ